MVRSLARALEWCSWLSALLGVCCLPRFIVPLLRCNLASIYSSGPGPLPLSPWWEGIPQRPNLKGDRSTSPPCPKVVFACKVAVDDAEVGSAMTSVLWGSWSWSCCTGMETFGWRFGNPRTSLLLLHQRGNCTDWRAGARLSFLASSLTPEAGFYIEISAAPEGAWGGPSLLVLVLPPSRG